MSHERSLSAFARARNVVAGGVNSPVRAFRAVGGSPIFMKSGSGAMIRDLDDREYIDYVLSWGPLILGHAHPAVVRAIQQAAARGTSFGTPTEAESELAELICAAVPSIERVRLTSSGTEAAMSALRLARAVTGRDAVVKFAGCYHGHADAFLIAAGSGALTHGVPSSPGVPASVARDTIVLPYNDVEALEHAFAAEGSRIAAVCIEPYAGNMGLVPPLPGYLAAVRDLCTRHGALLIFDEVMTGFRVARGGAQEREGVRPDLTVLGKVIGGGLPVGAFGGPCTLMEHLAPDGPVYQAGTLSGNPVAVAAGIATLKIIRDDATLYERLEVLAKLLADGLTALCEKHGIPCTATYAGSMFGLFFTAGPVRNLADAQRSDTARYAAYFHGMLERGIYLAPSQFEAGFVSTAHTVREIERTLAAADAALGELCEKSVTAAPGAAPRMSP
jgi:glutamate-1-semialdehyde 2,1-aminomutase